MKISRYLKQFSLAALLAFPLQAYAEYEWCPMVREPGKYQIVIEGVSCPVRSAKYKDRMLRVNYDCMATEGVRRGRFAGRQSGESEFRGQYIMQSKLGRLKGPLQMSFISPEQVMLTSRGKAYSAKITLSEAE